MSTIFIAIILIIITLGITLGCTNWNKKKDAQPQNQMPQGQQFQGQQSNMFCYNCGRQIEAGAGFCPFCGAAQNTQQ